MKKHPPTFHEYTVNEEALSLIRYDNSQVFLPGQKVRSLVNRPPTIQVGTMGRILSRWIGTLYAVKLPNGDLYRWLDNQDLFPVDTSQPNLRVGDLAVIQLCRFSHFYHPQLVNGAVVTIVKIVETDFYEIDFNGDGILGWFSGFEISTVF